MLNKEKYQLIMGRILKDIYNNTTIAPLLGFKGGTCAYLFYELPRFSVDLDFDSFSKDERTQKMVFEKIKAILEKYGEVKDEYLKRFTIFFLLSYGDVEHNIKVEVNIRCLLPNLKEYYELKDYLGISMFVGAKSYLFGSKLSALTLRKEIATRDIYDIWFFAKNNWDIDPKVVKAITGKKLKNYLLDCVKVIEQVNDNQILQGLGELLDEEGKGWVKKHLREETVFLLKNYQSVVK